MYKYIVIAFLIAGLGAFAWHKNKLAEASKLAKTEVVKEYADDALEQALEAVAVERDMIKQSLEDERKKTDEKQAIIASRDALIRSLQQRPKRESAKNTSAVSPLSCPSSTGAELYKEDGEFLAGEAARAAVIAKERDYYYQQYEQVRKIANESINN